MISIDVFSLSFPINLILEFFNFIFIRYGRWMDDDGSSNKILFVVLLDRRYRLISYFWAIILEIFTYKNWGRLLTDV